MKNASKLSYVNGVETGVFNVFIQNDNALIGAVVMWMKFDSSISSSVEPMNSHPFMLEIGVSRLIYCLLGDV